MAKQKKAQVSPMPKVRKGVRMNPDGKESTHLMRREYVPEEGGWVVFPSLFQDDDGTWVDMGAKHGDEWKPIYEEAVKRGEIYKFGKDEKAAIEFGDKGSWKKGPEVKNIPTKRDNTDVALTKRFAKGGKVKGYQSGGWVVNVSNGNVQYVDNLNPANLPPGTQLATNSDLQSAGIEGPGPTGPSAGGANSSQVGGNAVWEQVAGGVAGGLVGSSTGGLVGSIVAGPAGMLVGSAAGTALGAKYGAEKGPDMVKDLDKKFQDKKKEKEEEEKKEKKFEIDGSIALAQKMEDSNLKRKEVTEEGEKELSDNDKLFQMISQIPVIGQFAELHSNVDQLIRGDGSDPTRNTIANVYSPHHNLQTDEGNWVFKHGGMVKKGYASGGKIKGAGTAKSDSIDADVEPGSFVVPAENAGIAEKLRATYLPTSSNKVAELKDGGVPVKVSNGEHIFNPNEVAILKKNGINLPALAPNAEPHAKGYNKGGNVNPSQPIDITKPPKSKDKMTQKDWDEWAAKNQKYLENREAYLRNRQKAGVDVSKEMEEVEAKKQNIEKARNPRFIKDGEVRDDVYKAHSSNDEKADEAESALKEPTTDSPNEYDNIAKEDRRKNQEAATTALANQIRKDRANAAMKEQEEKEKAERRKNQEEASAAIVKKLKEEKGGSGSTSTTTTKKSELTDKEVALLDQIEDPEFEEAEDNKKYLTKSEEKELDAIDFEDDFEGLEEQEVDEDLPVDKKAVRRENRKVKQAEREANRDARRSERDGSGWDWVSRNSGAILGGAQALTGAALLAKRGERPEITAGPELQSAYDQAVLESQYGFDSATFTALTDKINRNLRGTMRGIEETGGTRGQQLGAKLQAMNKANLATSDIAMASEKLRVSKLPMVGDLAGKLQRVRNLSEQDKISLFDQNSASYAALVNTGLQNVIGSQQFNQLQDLRKEGQGDMVVNLNTV
jgi:hypothetical protein